MEKFYQKMLLSFFTIASSLVLMTGCNQKSGSGEENEEYDGPEQAALFQMNRIKDPATGKVPQERLMYALEQTMASKNIVRNSPSSVTALSWIERGPNSDVVGPSNGNTRANGGITSGRIDAMMVDSSDATHKTVWVGGRGGGLWKTTDITSPTATWTLVNDFFANMSISGIIQDPTDYNTMYFSTGESFGEGGALRGNGVFKSVDHGVTWTQLSSTTGNGFYYCTRILCDFQGNIYVGVRGPAGGPGIFRSTKASGGAVWTDITPTGLTNRVCDMEITSTGALSRLHVVFGIFSTQTYRYTDNPGTVTPGAGWVTPTTPFPSFAMRAEIGVSGSTLYAAPANGSYQVPTIYKSTDGGDNWVATTGQPASGWASGQGWYALTVGINPSDPNQCIVGGLDNYKTTDGGATWTKISAWVGTTGQYVHADQHTMYWYDGGTKLIFGCDGGVHFSADGGVTSRDRNTGLRLKQFYGVAVHPTQTNYFLCGAQDNGTHQLSNPGLGSSVEVTGGDGAITAIDQDEPLFQTGAYVYSNFRRSVNGGANWSGGPSNNNGQFINAYDMDNLNNRVYAGYSAGNYLRWEDPHTGFTYNPVAIPSFAGASVVSVTVSPFTANRVYFGTSSGRLVKVDNAESAMPTDVNIASGSMTGYLNSIIFGANENTMLACYSNYGINNIWSTTDGGTTWTSVDGNLPDMPVYWAVYHPEDNTKVYLATETGVWETSALSGASTVWVANAGFPTVRTDMLKYRTSDRTIAAATYGRGLWTSTIPAACTPTAITSQPVSYAACAGTNATFSVVADGSGLTYQWQLSTDNGVTWGPIAGQTSTTLSFASLLSQNGYRYRVVVTGTCAPLTVTSNAVTLTVNPLPVINTQPVNSTVCAGTSTSFTVAATGSPLTYQWQVSTDGGVTYTNVTNVAPYSNTTTTTLNITNTPAGLNGYRYKANVSGGCNPLVSSNGAILTVNSSPAITSQPANTAVCAGNNANFSVTATGGGLTYQWQLSTDNGVTYNDIVGQTSSTLAVTSVTLAMNNYRYRVNISGSCPAPITSAEAILSVGSAASITGQPANTTVCVGANASFNVTATGSSLTYQWQQSIDAGVTWTNVVGQTSSTLTLTSVTASMNGYQYRVNVFSCTATPITSNSATLTVNTLIAISSQPVASTICSGSNTSFSVTASGTGATYQWQLSLAGCAGPWANIVGATSNTYTITAAPASMNGYGYRVVVNGTCNSVTSNCALLTVNSPVTISAQPQSVALCLPGTTSFSITATGTGITYQWQLSTDAGATWGNIAGATTATYNPGTLSGSMNGYQYRVILTGTCTPTLTSSVAILTVNLPVAITTQPVNTPVCVGSNTQFTVAATGSTITYQWQVSINGGAFANLTNTPPYAGVTTNTLTISNTATNLDGTRYRVIVSGVPCGAVTSNTATLTVNQLPVPVLTLSSYSSITPYTRTMFYTTVSPAGNYSYQWYKNAFLVPSLTGPGFNASVDDFGEYFVVVTDLNTGCSSATNKVTVKDSVSNKVFIYPNPSSGIFQVRYYSANSTSRTYTLNIYDNKGSRVYSKAYPISRTYDRMDVNLKNVSSGGYLVEVKDESGNRMATGRVVISK
ncbi:MAG: T9SS type A sorting domain-containing protein [Ferruginibacter sp.]